MKSLASHVVLVEDNEAHAELVQEAFQSHPQFCLTVLYSLQAAKEFLETEQPDLLFIDLVLPDGRGSKLLPADREAAPYPAVLITSYGDEQTAVDVMKGGAFDYLTKSEQLFADMPRIAERELREWQEIVKRRKAEQSLRHREEHLRMALEAANAGTWEWDYAANQFTYSVGVERFFNLPPGELVANRNEVFKLIVPEDREAVLKIFDKNQIESSFNNDEPIQIEHRVYGAEDKVCWLSVHGKVIRDGQGEPMRVAGTVIDITSRKEAETKLQSTEDQLAHVSRVSTMGEMISGIAHELNQPLYTIQNYGKASLNLLAQDEAINIDQIREWVEEITETAAHAGEVLMRLRNFVRKVPSKRSCVKVKDVVETAVGMVRYGGRQRNIKIEDQVSEDLPMVIVDAVQIEQVLVNLLRNSFEAMEEYNEQGDATVVISAEKCGSKIELTVSDNGPGLPSENLVRIFDTFSTTKPEGMGLGLAIAKTIVEAHDGKLWVTSNVEGGASFHFTLPVDQER